MVSGPVEMILELVAKHYGRMSFLDSMGKWESPPVSGRFSECPNVLPKVVSQSRVCHLHMPTGKLGPFGDPKS